MAKSIEQVTPAEGIGWGSIMTGLGIFLLLRAAGITQIGEINVPPWVLAITGMVIFLPGACLIHHGLRNAVSPAPEGRGDDPNRVQFCSWLLGPILMTGLSLIFGWVAFGPGERRFHGGITGSPIEGRIAFGIATVIFTLLSAVAWVYTVRQLFARLGAGPRTGLPYKTAPRPRRPQR